MNLTPDVKAHIENHLQAVRANLGDKERVDPERDSGRASGSHQRDARPPGRPGHGRDDPGGARRDGRPCELRRGTGEVGRSTRRRRPGAGEQMALCRAGVSRGEHGGRVETDPDRAENRGFRGEWCGLTARWRCPMCRPATRRGFTIRPPDGRRPRRKAAPARTSPADKSTLRSIAFLENRNPVIQQPAQELSWLFNEDVVEAAEVGKPLARNPLKITPEVAGGIPVEDRPINWFSNRTSRGH